MLIKRLFSFCISLVMSLVVVHSIGEDDSGYGKQRWYLTFTISLLAVHLVMFAIRAYVLFPSPCTIRSQYLSRGLFVPLTASIHKPDTLTAIVRVMMLPTLYSIGFWAVATVAQISSSVFDVCDALFKNSTLIHQTTYSFQSTHPLAHRIQILR